MTCNPGNTGGINYSEYFTQTSELIERSANDGPYSSDEYEGDPVKIKVRISGGERFYINDEHEMSVAERVYKTLHPVKIRDIIDGQIVVYVKTVYEFDGSLAYYKAYV